MGRGTACRNGLLVRGQRGHRVHAGRTNGRGRARDHSNGREDRRRGEVCDGIARTDLEEKGGQQPAPGGQIYRAVETAAAAGAPDREVLGPDYAAGLPLAEAFRGSGATYQAEATVWRVDPGGPSVAYSRAGKAGVAVDSVNSTPVQSSPVVCWMTALYSTWTT